MRLVQYAPRRPHPSQSGAGWLETDGTLVNAIKAYRLYCNVLGEEPEASTEAHLSTLTGMVRRFGLTKWREVLEIQRLWQSRHRAGDECAAACTVEPSQIRCDMPLKPHSFRDFYAFEQHVQSARKNRGLEMVPQWYEFPVFYFSNTGSFRGPEEPVWAPAASQALDFELEIAAVIGKSGISIAAKDADDFIAGYTILNDWSARDIQREEVKVGLGPAKGKDFATSFGPMLVTPDELLDVQISESRGSRFNLKMTASVNGHVISEGNCADIHYTFAEMIERASADVLLEPLDVIGSGTVGTGCITEFPPGTYPWLQPGDVVRLEVERLGVLETPIIERP
jgi:fumarylacetoacetate (FAA) hydrolase